MVEKVALIGLGKIGFEYDLNRRNSKYISSHANAFIKHNNFEIVAGIDITSEKRNAFFSEYKIETYEKINSEVIDLEPSIVVISTPTETHPKILNDVLKKLNPKIILCEKPLSYSVLRSKEIIEICNKKNIRLFVNYMRKSDVSTRLIYNMLLNEEIKYPIKANIWYSKGIFNNASHLMSLLELWLGPQIDEKIINRGNIRGKYDYEPDFFVNYVNGTANFIAAREENFSIYTIELIAQNGRLYYSNGGEKITWQPSIKDELFDGYSILDEDEIIIENKLYQSQMNVVNEIDNFINNKEYFLCTGEEALVTIENIHKIVSLIQDE